MMAHQRSLEVLVKSLESTIRLNTQKTVTTWRGRARGGEGEEGGSLMLRPSVCYVSIYTC